MNSSAQKGFFSSFFKKPFALFLILQFTFISSVYSADENTLSNIPSNASVEVTERKVREDAEEKLLQPKQVQEPQVEQETKQAPAQAEKSFVVSEIQMTGDTVVPFSEFRPLLKEYENREITFTDLFKLTQALEQAYRAKGFVAGVLIPPQHVEKGKPMLLQVTVSKMGKLHIEGNRFYRKAPIRARWKTHQGESLRYSQIQHDLISMNENPDKTVRTVLAKSEIPEEIDVVLKVEDRLPLHVGYGLDNRGAKLTGKWRNTFTFRDNNMLGLDDVFLIGTSFGDRFGVLFLQHMIPLNSYGTTFVWGFSHAQVTPMKEFRELGINGISQTYTTSLRQKLYQSGRYALFGKIGFDFKEKTTTVLNTTANWDRLRVLNTGFEGQALDSLGAWSTSQTVSYGFPLTGDGFPLNSRGGESQFVKFELSLKRYQKMPFKTKLTASFQAQLTDSSLMPEEQFFLGGADTVRGYPESDYGSDRGFVSNFEYVIPFSSYFFAPSETPNPRITFRSLYEDLEVNLLAFTDFGYGNVTSPSATEHESRFLLGVGGGLEFRWRKYLTARLEWAARLGDRAITEAGNSQFHFRLSSDY